MTDALIKRLVAAQTAVMHGSYVGRMAAGRELGEATQAVADRLALPVIATCGACLWVGSTSGGWSCDHPTSIARQDVDYDAVPPEWCPMRGGK